MKQLLLFLLAPLCIISMETPTNPSKTLTEIPLEGHVSKLTSFAESMIRGKLMIGKQICGQNTSICFMFNDFRNPEISYTVSQEQAWNTTRYIAAIRLKELIEDTNTQLSKLDNSSDIIEMQKKYIAERLAKYRQQLLELNVSESLPILPRTIEATNTKFKELEITEEDSEVQKAFKTVLIIEAFENLKQEPAILRCLAFDRFYRFWSYEDLNPQTKKDRTERDFTRTKEQRIAFFAALKNNDNDKLIEFSEKMSSIVPKEKASTLGTIDKMIRNIEKAGHLNNGSPQNSDEEIW